VSTVFNVATVAAVAATVSGAGPVRSVLEGSLEAAERALEVEEERAQSGVPWGRAVKRGSR